MKRWVDLYLEHRSIRSVSREVTGQIRQRLMNLAERGHCDTNIRGRFTHERGTGNRHSYYIAGRPDRTEPLRGLPHLPQARLSVLVQLDLRRGHLYQLNIMLEGRRHDDSPWTVAVHLPDAGRDPDTNTADQQGSGACGHAALHGHVGPDLDTPPKVRVPLPALTPAEALDWVLSQVIENWDPAPWPQVNDDLLSRGRSSSTAR